MSNYPAYYRRQLCCGQANYIRRFSTTQGDYVVVADGVAIRKSLVTFGTAEEFERYLMMYEKTNEDEFNQLNIPWNETK